MQIKGIKLKIHPTFIGILIISALCGFAVRAFIVFGLVILHELIHMLVAVAFGIRVKSIELYPYGGTAVLEDTFEGKRMEETMIAFAGPAFNLTLFFIIQYLRWEGIIQGEWVLELAKINFWLASFNLIPVLPLDGGRIARAFFSRIFGFVQTTRFLATAGKWLGGIFVILGFLFQALSFVMVEPVLLIILGVFFWIGSRKEITNARMVFLKQLCRKKEQLLDQGLMRSNCITVSKDTSLGKIIDMFTTDQYCLISVIENNNRIARTLSETEVIQGMMDRGLDSKAGELCRS